ncbi:MAG TPA: MFS transporter [Candidatus Limnocylindrales bacterium]|nr:MFS transporter [Candidatus Limnocylindrales bacterium]
MTGSAERDRATLLSTAFLRALATGLIGVELGLYLTHLDLGASRVGLVVAAGLLGGALAALVATFAADRLGRRRMLFTLTILGSIGCAVAAASSSFVAVAAASFAGMLNGMGRDRGAALVIEQAMLPATTTHDARTRVFAWYNVAQDAGHALGSLAAGLPTLLVALGWAGGLGAHRSTMLVAAALTLAPLPLYFRLGPEVEAPRSADGSRPARRLSTESRGLLVRISALFAIDSLAGGLLVTSLLSYFFFERFAVTEATIGALFFAARLLNAVSHLGAAWLAKRIGLVNTMVFTHIPSSLLLVTVAFAPSFPVAAVLFLLREGLVEMDVPTRQSYVMAVVRPEEATFASGVTSLVRLAAWAAGPGLAGFFMQSSSLMTPLVVGAGMKITYDLLLWRAFRKVRPPEELP